MPSGPGHPGGWVRVARPTRGLLRETLRIVLVIALYLDTCRLFTARGPNLRYSEWFGDLPRVFASWLVPGRREYSMCLEALPEIAERLARIETEYALTNAPDVQAATFQIALARGILFVAIHAVPCVPVTLDGQTPVHALHNQVDPATGDLELRDHSVPTPGDTQEYVQFKPALEGVRLVA